MATVNKRVGIPQAFTINGVDAGGAMTANIQIGYDNILRSAPDGLQVPLKDREVEFVRGTIVTQDWIELINILTGVVGTYVFYERKSGAAEETGFVEHTLNNPVVHRASIRLSRGGYATASFDFECRPADETEGIADMWALLDSQAAPTYIAAARGGWRILTCKHNPGASEIDIYHVTDFDFNLALPLVRACNDGDVGYTCVDARVDGLTAAGSLSFQDATIAAGIIKAQALAAAVRASLQLEVVQSQGATNKVITIAGVDFNNVGSNSDVNADFTGYTAAFEVSNNTTTQLTLAGANKIITIEDAV